MPMRVVFAGTPEFAAVALRALLAAGHTVPLVLTQPDRPAGRGLKLQPSAVKQVALAHGLKVAQPLGLRLDGRWPDEAQAAKEALLQAQAEVMVVAAYGLILPAWVLQTPPLGCLNIHASLLPRWRGAAPIHRAIEAEDDQTGVTIMQMDEGLDTGPMLLQQPLPIGPQDTTGTLTDALAHLGARLLLQALELAHKGTLAPTAQPADGVTYARKIDKSEATLDWSRPAAQLDAAIRAFNPAPGAATLWANEPVKVWRAQAHAHAHADAQAPQAPTPRAGRILEVRSDAVRVACGRGVLDLQELQRPSGRRQPAGAVAQALGWKVGDALGAHDPQGAEAQSG